MNQLRKNWLPAAFFTPLIFSLTSFLLFAEEQPNNLADKEALQLEREVSWLTALMWGLLIALLLLALAIRFIARRTTHPCRWCMEFIPNKALDCPRCGKQGG